MKSKKKTQKRRQKLPSGETCNKLLNALPLADRLKVVARGSRKKESMESASLQLIRYYFNKGWLNDALKIAKEFEHSEVEKEVAHKLANNLWKERLNYHSHSKRYDYHRLEFRKEAYELAVRYMFEDILKKIKKDVKEQIFELIKNLPIQRVRNKDFYMENIFPEIGRLIFSYGLNNPRDGPRDSLFTLNLEILKAHIPSFGQRNIQYFFEYLQLCGNLFSISEWPSAFSPLLSRSRFFPVNEEGREELFYLLVKKRYYEGASKFAEMLDLNEELETLEKIKKLL